MLGSGAFIDRLRIESTTREQETRRPTREVVALLLLGRMISSRERAPEAELRAGIRMRGVVRARRLFCQIVVKGMGNAGADVARLSEVPSSSVNPLAKSTEIPEVKKYLKAL